jgi:hypothetical protein
MLDFCTGQVGLAVHHEANDTGHCASYRHLDTAHQWNITQTQFARRQGGKFTNQIGRCREPD